MAGSCSQRKLSLGRRLRAGPQVPPVVCALLALLAMSPCLVALWRRAPGVSLSRACAYAALCAFVFGFHVHEKAALTVTVLLALEADTSSDRRRCARRQLVPCCSPGTRRYPT